MLHLSVYQNSIRTSTPVPGLQRQEPAAAALRSVVVKPVEGQAIFSSVEGTGSVLDGAAPDAPLVNRCISHQEIGNGYRVKRLQVWPRAVKLVREFNGKKQEEAPPRGEIESFSLASKRRLKFTAANAFPELVSQFGMTYHKTSPDGRTIKHHLDAFLKALRYKFPEAKYLWILEFQTRGVPHYHLFLTQPHDTPGLHKYLAETWHRIAEPGSREHLRFHRHARNFIAWDMGSGSYLCKYLDKEHQKAVPPGFMGVGRFWGSSRGLVPPPIEYTPDYSQYSHETVDQETGEVQEFKATEYVLRQLCRHHEKSLRKSPWRSSARRRPTSYTLPNGAGVLRVLEKWVERQIMPDDVPF